MRKKTQQSNEDTLNRHSIAIEVFRNYVYLSIEINEYNIFNLFC